MDTTSLIVGIAWILTGALLWLLSRPLVAGKVKRNLWYGVRFRESFASEEAWRRINRHGGRLGMRWALVIVAVGTGLLLVPMEGNDALAIACALGPAVFVLIPAIQSKRFARNLADEQA